VPKGVAVRIRARASKLILQQQLSHRFFTSQRAHFLVQRAEPVGKNGADLARR